MKKIWVLVLMAALVACGGVDNEALKNKVLDTHDEVMPKMGQVMNLKKQVVAKAAELESADSSNEKITELRDLAGELEAAYQGMMTWMRDWSESSDPYTKGEVSPSEVTAYYESEQAKVDKVKADINGSIAKAKEALK